MILIPLILVAMFYQGQGAITNGLVHHWSFDNGSKNDVVGGAHLLDSQNASYTTDRFGVANNALRLDSGYYHMPNGTYVSGDFTISAWIKVRKFTSYTRIIELSNMVEDRVFMVLSIMGSPTSGAGITSGTKTLTGMALATHPLVLDTWMSIAFTCSGQTGILYINGVLSKQIATYPPNNVVRTFNYIGKSSNNNPNAYADFDEIKIFNRALSAAEIASL